jgi:hypothetical protein
MSESKKNPPSVGMSLADLAVKSEKVYEKDAYANHVQVSLSTTELFVDFFFVSPQFSTTAPVKTQHVGRLITSVALAKGLASALANVVASHEEEHNIILPNSRTPDPDDKIVIWP